MGDMLKKLMEKKPGVLTIGYQPEGERLSENPPRFTWMPESEQDDVRYCLQICGSPDFAGEDLLTVSGIPYNFCTLDRILKKGHYFWRYSVEGYHTYSRVREFDITGEEAETPLPGRKARYQSADMAHPRIWLNPAKLEAFQKELKKNDNYCGFKEFMKKSAEVYAGERFVQEPSPYPGNKRVVALWRGNYQICQRALEYIRSLSVAGRLLNRKDYLDKAKKALLELAAWDTNGPTSRDYNDECSFRVAYALAFGYDWLYDILTEQEREQVRRSLLVRTKQVADHIIIESRVHAALYDSHAVRSLSSVITPCCIALLGESEEARQWLDYAIEYFNVIYTPWGKEQGGWAEGGMYWTSGMAFVIDALNIIKSFLGIDIYKRPFFQKTGDFPLYCMPADTYRASFCDQSNLGKYPGLKTAYNMRQFAGVTGNADYQWYYEQVLEREKEPDQDFFNKGWWDFAFDNMVYLHDYGQNVLHEVKTEAVRWFRDVGWAAIHKDMKSPKDHIFLLTKSSPYGSVSHSHGDQNSFLLFAFGEPLIIESGYYVGYNTSMHRDWRRQTYSQNVILIDGKGQYAGMDKEQQLAAKGRICDVRQSKDDICICEDATQAYLQNVPNLIEYKREIHFVNEEYFLIEDTVETKEETQISWLLHSLDPFEIGDNFFRVRREKADLEGRLLNCSSGIQEISQTDEFINADPEEIKGLDKQWHFTMKTGKSKSHKITVMLIPRKK